MGDRLSGSLSVKAFVLLFDCVTDFLSVYLYVIVTVSLSDLCSGDQAAELLKMLLLEAVLKGGGGEPGDRLVTASSNGNIQSVREILEANPDKVINQSIN